MGELHSPRPKKLTVPSKSSRGTSNGPSAGWRFKRMALSAISWAVVKLDGPCQSLVRNHAPACEYVMPMSTATSWSGRCDIAALYLRTAVLNSTWPGPDGPSDPTEIRTRVTSFKDYRYTAGTQNQTPVLRKGDMYVFPYRQLSA